MKNKILSIAIVVIMLTQMSPFVSMTASAEGIDPITIEINGNYNEENNTISSISAIVCTGASLSLAVKKHTDDKSSIEKLKITAGEFTESDWKWLKELSGMNNFEIAEDVGVAEMPTDTLLSTSIFPKSIFSVNIPQVTNVGDKAFNECSSLKEVNLPKVTEIGEYAFMKCINLSNVNIPKVNTIEDWAFNGCSSLEKAEFLEATVIGNAAFKDCKRLTTLNFPNLTAIRGGTFNGCTSLQEITTPLVSEIGDTAFNGCTSLQEITAPLVSEIGKSAFMDCTVLKTADFPKLESISYEAFKNCKALTTVTFPAVTDIGDIAFYGCTSLTKVEFPQAKIIGYSAFQYCSGLIEVKFELATTMKKQAFFECKALKKAYFPKLENISYWAFNNCWELATVDFPEVKRIWQLAFNNCKALTTVTFPAATDIGTSAFSGCRGLTTVDFPMVTEVGENAFNSCQSLINAEFSNAETLSKYAFSKCHALQIINFPSVNEIGENAFDNCLDLNTVSFPKVTNIATEAFERCSRLGTLKLGPTPPTVTDNPFSSTLKTNPLVLLDAEGEALIEGNLTAAQNAYKAVNDGDTSDDLWYDWTIMELPEATYKVVGAVEDAKKNSISGAAVKLMKGNTQFGTENIKTNSEGKFTIIDVPNGTYNLVVNKGGITVTSLVVVNSLDKNLTGAIILPSGKTSSVVEISGSGTPEVVVGNLEVQFSSLANEEDKGVTSGDKTVVEGGGSVEIKFTAEKKMEKDASNSGDIKSRAVGDGKTIDSFLELTVKKTVTASGSAATITQLTSLQDMIDIVIPLELEMQGKEGYVVYRFHGTEVDTITETKNVNGEYITINSDNTITLHVKKFSTYAIGYNSPASPAPPIDNGNGGTSSSNKINKSKNSSEPIFKQPDNESDIPYYIKDGNKVYIGFSALSGDKYKYIVPNGATVEFQDNSKNFLDNDLEWSKTSIDFVTQREIFLGINQNIFGHDESMTRGMFVTVVGRLYERSYGEISGTSTFSDIDTNEYYANYVAWANDNGIIKGMGDNKFLPEEKVTREQMAVIMLNFAALLNKTDSLENPLEYVDYQMISPWAQEGAKYCQKTKVVTGRDGGVFAPQESATRAEVAVVIDRFVKTIVQ